MQQHATPAVDKAVAHEDKAAAKKLKSVIKDLKTQKALVRELKAENKKLEAGAETLKGSIATQKTAIAKLKADVKAANGKKAIAAMKRQLDKGAAHVAKLEKALAAAKVALDEKNVALVAAEEVIAGFEDMRSTLANSVDTYSAQSQALSAEVEEYRMQFAELENALEDRTKLLVAGGEELARTKLNMNILLSKIAAQNKSLSILEDTRISLEKDLAKMMHVVEELQHQLSAQVIVDAVIVEEVPVEEVPVEEVAPAN